MIIFSKDLGSVEFMSEVGKYHKIPNFNTLHHVFCLKLGWCWTLQLKS